VLTSDSDFPLRETDATQPPSTASMIASAFALRGAPTQRDHFHPSGNGIVSYLFRPKGRATTTSVHSKFLYSEHCGPKLVNALAAAVIVQM